MDTNVFNDSEELFKPTGGIVHLSNQYEIKIGGFGEEGSGIKTYSCSVTVSDLKEDITTFKKLSEDKYWPVSQIIQREVEQKRVMEISNEYIRRESRYIKYFPPLIVAILPISEENKIAKDFTYSNDISPSQRISIYEKSKFYGNEKAKEVFLKAKNLSNLKNLFVVNLSEPFNYNLLSWDRASYYAVVIDGQHRYEALLESATKDPKILNYVQDIAFIDVSFVLNKLSSGNKPLNPVQAIRTVFVDINNNAMLITPARRILMDDKDVASLFVQSLVNDENDNGERKGKFIQPQLVDWHVESYKHTLPHITSVLILYQLMTDYLLKKKNLSSIDDLRENSRVRSWVSIVNEKFCTDKLINKKEEYDGYIPLLESLKAYEDIGELEDGEDPLDSVVFSFDYRVLKIAQKTFEEIFCESIVKCFYELKPYSIVISYLEKENAFSKETTLFKALISNQEEVKRKETYKQEIARLKKLLEEDTASYSLLYSVIGQKALFELFFKKMDAGYDNSFTKEKANSIADSFISEINSMLEVINKNENPLFGEKDTIAIGEEFSKKIPIPGTIVTSFWEGIIYQEKRIIYNAQGISSLRSLIEYILEFIAHYKDEKKELTADRFSIKFLSARVVRSIKRNNEDYEDQASELAEQIIDAKRKFLNDYLIKAIKK